MVCVCAVYANPRLRGLGWRSCRGAPPCAESTCAVLLVLFRPDLTQTSSAQVKAVTRFWVSAVTCKPGGGVRHRMPGAENLFFFAFVFAVLSKLNSGYRFRSPGSLSRCATGVRKLPCCYSSQHTIGDLCCAPRFVVVRNTHAICRTRFCSLSDALVSANVKRLSCRVRRQYF